MCFIILLSLSSPLPSLTSHYAAPVRLYVGLISICVSHSFSVWPMEATGRFAQSRFVTKDPVWRHQTTCHTVILWHCDTVTYDVCLYLLYRGKIESINALHWFFNDVHNFFPNILQSIITEDSREVVRADLQSNDFNLILNRKIPLKSSRPISQFKWSTHTPSHLSLSFILHKKIFYEINYSQQINDWS